MQYFHFSFLLLFVPSHSYAVNGQMVGVGAGQQSRVDCVKLAGTKAALWFLRQHPKVQALPFKKSVKKQDRINARVSVMLCCAVHVQDHDFVFEQCIVYL